MDRTQWRCACSSLMTLGETGMSTMLVSSMSTMLVSIHDIGGWMGLGHCLDGTGQEIIGTS
jgi:hypothetical protein